MRTAVRRAPSPWPPSASARATPSAWASGTSGTCSATSAARRRWDRRIRPGHATVRSLAAALAGLPAAREDVGAPPDATNAAVTDLERRYTAVRNAATAAVADARAALEPTATDARRRATLGRLARWGITPLRADVPDPNLGDLTDRVGRAADALEQRVADAPVTTEGATAAALASAISALVAPEGPWPVFARLPAVDVRRPAGRADRSRLLAPPRPGLVGDGGAGTPGAGPPRSGAARPAPGDRRTAVAGVDEPPRRPVADGGATVLGHRSRAPLAPGGRVRAAGCAARPPRSDDTWPGRGGGDRPLRRDGAGRRAGQRGRLPARPPDGAGAPGRRPRGASGA